MRLLQAILVSFLTMLPVAAASETYLFMAEEHGCPWCARWDREISEIYPKTPEGRAAPLRRFDIHTGQPENVLFERRVTFTPTFILVRDNVEIGRIEGYPGEDFFWGLLAVMLERAQTQTDEAG